MNCHSSHLPRLSYRYKIKCLQQVSSSSLKPLTQTLLSSSSLKPTHSELHPHQNPHTHPNTSTTLPHRNPQPISPSFFLTNPTQSNRNTKTVKYPNPKTHETVTHSLEKGNPFLHTLNWVVLYLCLAENRFVLDLGPKLCVQFLC